MEMETEETLTIPPSTTSDKSLSPVFLWCSVGNSGLKKQKLEIDLNSLTLTELKNAATKELGLKSPEEIDILYNGKKLMNEEALKSASIKPMAVIHTVQKSAAEKAPLDVAAVSKNVSSQITQIALALRTAFLNPSFIPMIEKLGQTDMLENILAIAPGLKDDLVGVAIIQDPAMIFHLHDVESLKKLAISKPWVVEAFNFLAGSVHQEKGAARGNRIPSHLFSSQSIFEGDDDEDMDDDGDAEGAGLGTRITREQLSAALNSLNALGRGALSSLPGQAPGSQVAGTGFLDFIAQATGQTASSNPSQQTTGSSLPGMADLLSGASGSSQSLTADVVARAMAEALGRLPESQRTDQLNAIRNLASQIQQHNSPSSNPNATGQVPPVTSTPAQQPSGSDNSNPMAVQYRDQLAQMREMGIHDENLSVLALRVSDGDVGTAVELIMSGWTGEGANSQMGD